MRGGGDEWCDLSTCTSVSPSRHSIVRHLGPFAPSVSSYHSFLLLLEEKKDLHFKNIKQICALLPTHMRWVHALLQLCWAWPKRTSCCKRRASGALWEIASCDCPWKAVYRQEEPGGSPSDDVYISSPAAGISVQDDVFFFLFRPGLLCFFSTRSVVFIGGAADDAATLENCWCDFYRRTGNMGHKTRLHFPQADKKHSPPPPPSLSKHRTSVGSLSHWRVCVCDLLHTPLENTLPAGFGVTSHWDIFRGAVRGILEECETTSSQTAPLGHLGRGTHNIPPPAVSCLALHLPSLHLSPPRRLLFFLKTDLVSFIDLSHTVSMMAPFLDFTDHFLAIGSRCFGPWWAISSIHCALMQLAQSTSAGCFPWSHKN